MDLSRPLIEPTVEATEVDVAWAAGFLEGEGTFCGSPAGENPARPGYKIGGDTCVKAAQVNVEPLYRLQVLFGGSVRLQQRRGIGRQEIYLWCISARKARRCIDLVLPYLSGRRHDQAVRARAYTETTERVN